MKLRVGVAVAVLFASTLFSSGHRFANRLVLAPSHADPTELALPSSAGPRLARSIDSDGLVTSAWAPRASLDRETWPHHLASLTLHLLCVMGVFWAVLLWLEDRWAALYGALVFAVHPWAVEGHVWIDGRSTPAGLALVLVGMIALLYAERRRSIPLLVVAGAALSCGLLTKGTLLLVLPAVALMPPMVGAVRDMRGRLAVGGIAATVYLGVRTAALGVQTEIDSAALAGAAKNLPWLLVDALRQCVAPERPYLRSLRDEYASLEIWQSTLAVLAFLALVIVAMRAREKAPLAAWSALWFFAPLLPVAIITTVLWPGFGRFLYVPLAGFAWGLAALVPFARERIPKTPLRVGVGVLHVLLLAALAALNTADFATSESLFQRAIGARPEIAMGHGWLGMARAERGDHREALVPLMRAAQIDPSTHRYLIHAGRSVLATGDRPNAHAIAERGIRRFEDRPEEASYHLLAVDSMSAPDPERTIGHLVRGVEVWPEGTECREALRVSTRDASQGEANRRALDALVARRPELDALLR